MTNTGGTLQDAYNYGDKAATQNYQNVLNNDQSIYGMNLQTQYLAPYQAAWSKYQMQYPQAAADAASKNAYNWNGYIADQGQFNTNRNFLYNGFQGLIGNGLNAQ